jgi:hypothetical protein
MNRRDFVRISIASAAALPAARSLAAISPDRSIGLTVRPEIAGNPIPPDFTGLSYESAVLSDPTFFAPDTTDLVGFVRRLGKNGVLRIGGNTSEYSVWTPSDQPHPESSQPLGPDSGGHAPPRRPITPQAIRNLRGFLDASGWTLIYGLNFGTEDPETCADEASTVAKEIGPRLVALQFGNEADLFSRNGLRKPDYDFEQFAAEWRRYFDAIRRRVPNAAFSGPDTAVNSRWLADFAKRFGRDVRFLSQHYYAEGPPSDPGSTISHLLDSKNARLDSLIDGMTEAKENAPGVPFRLTETNSCYGGGKADVSNTFASALWGADLMYRMAAAGALGINFHGGGNGWYSPIVGTRAAGFAARPLYYGMLMFAEAGAGHLVPTAIDNPTAAPLFTAYAVKNPDRRLKLALINKHEDIDVDVRILLAEPAPASAQRLSAPGLADTHDTTFGRAPVGSAGSWSPQPPESIALPPHGSPTPVGVPRASAVLVTFG